MRAAFQFFEEHPEFVRLIRREALDGGPMLSEQLGWCCARCSTGGSGSSQAQMDAGLLRRYDPAQLLLTGYGAALSYLSDAPLIAEPARRGPAVARGPPGPPGARARRPPQRPGDLSIT